MGFEPTDPVKGSLDFESSSFGHSDTSPILQLPKRTPFKHPRTQVNYFNGSLDLIRHLAVPHPFGAPPASNRLAAD